MSAFQQQLRDATSKNRELLQTLSQTDYARPALKQTTAYITDLNSQIAAADKELQRLGHMTQDERKDHVKYRDRSVYWGSCSPDDLSFSRCVIEISSSLC